MIAQKFQEANTVFGPPADLTESQCQTVPAYIGEIETGPLEGSKVIVMAYKPTDEELLLISQGQPIFLSILGPSLPPHMLSTSFFQATHPQ